MGLVSLRSCAGDVCQDLARKPIQPNTGRCQSTISRLFCADLVAKEFAFLTLLFQPALLLIDFGHFQYNSVMLGV